MSYEINKSKPVNHRLNAKNNESNHKDVFSDVNALKEPKYLSWEWGYSLDENDEDERVPICPSCGEMPYSFEQCVFCGQRFIHTRSGSK